MTVVPATFEEIQNFLNEQERIITKSIKNDSTLQKLIKKNKIDINNETLDIIIKKINKQMKRKYRMVWFTRQLRFQITQQIIQLERGNEDDKIKRIENVNNILKIFQDENNDIKVIGDNVLNLVKELPDSNLLETNNVDIIEYYDDIRENLINDIKRRNKIRKSVEKLKEINFRIENICECMKNEKSNEEMNQQERLIEIENMKKLLDQKLGM
ncbi:hypothetical protein C6P40_001337 [Pichia californica]|uniref:Uncharacterized protein n=1 Tax=Pichia californica TaxID=460514 RepID=A0A9P6WJ94_9ASCO|nr:hypothetical protein C6P42_001433 [[Candida] californica]KAG0688161.1 hypothetical protein C6P40_001337 [[Candida] californica]